MKIMYMAALLAGTSLLAPSISAQEHMEADRQGSVAGAQSGQAAASREVRQHLSQARQSLEGDDIPGARSAIAEALRALEQDSSGNRQAVVLITEPLRRADQALQQQDSERARQELNRLEQQFADTASAGTTETAQADVTVEPSGAEIRVDVPEPEVSVRQSNPQVVVQQSQPEIVVHQPAPVVRIEIPQPQITVRMPDPEVNVSQAQPQVEVEQGQPEVRVSESEPQVRVGEADEQARVEVERSGQASVRIQDAQREPQVRYTSEEPQVSVDRAAGEPEVRFEEQVRQQAASDGESEQVGQRQDSAGQRNAAADVEQQNPTANEQRQNAEGVDAQSTAAVSQIERRDGANMAVAANSSREVMLTVGDVKDYPIVGANGNNLGDIEEVVNVDNRLYAVVASGGFFGLGEDRAAVPLSSFHVTEAGTLVAENLTEQRIDGMPNFQSGRYAELPDAQPLTLGAR